jgi:hypothetical protein
VLALVLVLLGLSASCVRSPQPCRSPEHCSESSECLAHRCVPLGAEPVTPGTRRLVVEAAAVAVARRGAASAAALPATVTLGGPGAGAEQLLVRFPRSWAALEVENAFLLLSPAQSADPTGADVQVEVALASEPWAPGTLEGPRPVQGPRSLGLARTRPPALLRIDVTAQLRELQAHPASDLGLVVAAEQATGHGATYVTGVAGELPRLDVYFRLP